MDPRNPPSQVRYDNGRVGTTTDVSPRHRTIVFGCGQVPQSAQAKGLDALELSSPGIGVTYQHLPSGVNLAGSPAHYLFVCIGHPDMKVQVVYNMFHFRRGFTHFGTSRHIVICYS